MRRCFYSATMILVALFLYSCTRELESPVPPTIPEENLQEIILTAAMESQPDTRTSRHSDGKVYWSPGDKISLFYGPGQNGGMPFTSQNTEDALQAQFKGTIDVVTIGGEGASLDDITFWGIYPYQEDNECDGSTITTTLPDVQTAKAGTFDNNLFISMGKSTALNIAFLNVCSGIKFTLSHPNIERIELSGNNNETLAGRFKVGYGSDGKPEVKAYLEPKTTISVVAPNGGTFQVGQTYYLITLPVKLTAGMTMKFIARDGNTAIRRWPSQTITFSRNIFKTSTSIDADATFMETVDLGLPSGTLWATCNLGATTPEAIGNYYAWGELAPRTDTYSSQNATIVEKYQDPTLTELEPEDDAAYYLMGGDWRLPTKAQMQELKANCTWSNSTQNGVSGYTVTGTNGNSIFLPKTGFIASALAPGSMDYVFLWSSTKSDEDGMAVDLRINTDGSQDISKTWYRLGMAIRPVRSVVPVTSIEIEGKHGMTILSTQQLTAKIYPSNATNQHVTWSSSDESIATVTQDGVVTAHARGNVSIYAVSDDHGKTGLLDLYVANEPGVVDLGLPSGTKWAQYDIGTWMSGYAGWRFYRNKTTPSTAGDAETGDPATYFFGEGWSRPTKEQIQELIDNCTWNYYSGFMTDVPGWYATSTVAGYTDKRIFFPVDPDFSTNYYWSNNWEYVGNPQYSYGSYSLRLTDSSYELGFITDNNPYSSPKGYVRPVKNN